MRHQNGGGRRGKQEEGMRDREGGENPLTLSFSHAAVEGEVEATHSFTFPYSLKRGFKREGERERGGQGTKTYLLHSELLKMKAQE